MTSAVIFDSLAFKEAQRTDWQLAAAGWRRWHDVLEAEAAGQVVSRKLVELADLEPGDTVLDIATGYGEPALAAARAVLPRGHVIATDIAPDLLAFGRERAGRAGLDNVEFREADAETLEFPDETFDAVLCRQGLQFLPDVAGTLHRLNSALRSGGRLAAAVWGPLETVQVRVGHPDHREGAQLAASSVRTTRPLCAWQCPAAGTTRRRCGIQRYRDRNRDADLRNSLSRGVHSMGS